MKLLLLFEFFTLLHAGAEPETFRESRVIFGVPFRWETTSSTKHQWLKERVSTLAERFQITLDPDCLWRQTSMINRCENPWPQESENIEKVVGEIRKETLGFYDPMVLTNGVSKRDFGGISEGLLLETLAKDRGDSWIVGFGADIYVAPGSTSPDNLFIADPLDSRIRFAQIRMSSGWISTANSRLLGAQMRRPKNKTSEWEEDFQRLVLFAGPTFSGTKLDGWSTAVMAGGIKLLKHLESLSAYRNQWGYFYFDKTGKPYCSRNLKCRLEGDHREVTVSFLK